MSLHNPQGLQETQLANGAVEGWKSASVIVLCDSGPASS